MVELLLRLLYLSAQISDCEYAWISRVLYFASDESLLVISFQGSFN